MQIRIQYVMWLDNKDQGRVSIYYEVLKDSEPAL